MKIENLPYLDRKPFSVKKTVDWNKCPHCDKKIRNPNRIGWNWNGITVPEDMRPFIIIKCKFCFKDYCYHNNDIAPMIKSYQQRLINHVAMKMEIVFNDFQHRSTNIHGNNRPFGFVYLNGKFFNFEGCENLITIFQQIMERNEISPKGEEICDREDIK